jgi:hypothetical protein
MRETVWQCSRLAADLTEKDGVPDKENVSCLRRLGFRQMVNFQRLVELFERLFALNFCPNSTHKVRTIR